MSLVREVSMMRQRARTGAAALTTMFALGAFAVGCGGDRRGSGDTAIAAGDAGSIEVDALNYEVTSERYQRWVAAQRALDAISGLPEPPWLDPVRVSEAEITRAVEYLESDARARAALSRAGIGARDYVMTTIALDQALLASAGGDPSGSTERAAAPAGTARSGTSGGSGGSGARTAEGSPTTGTSRAATPARSRTRVRNLPPANAELVERNRDDIARVRRDTRFRIVKEQVDTVYVDRPAEPARSPSAVPAGTAIALRSDARVCTSTHRPGARVTARVAAPASGSAGATIPAGSAASLSVVGARSGEGAPMEFTLNSITVGGRTYSVAGTAVASRVERVRVGSAGKDAQKVAGGAAIGAVAGQVLGRDTKSTVIGAAVGAAAGAAAANASARFDTCVPAGGAIQVTLRDALNLRV